MKAAMIFTGSGPILILTSFDSLEHPTLTEKLGARGITKYIAYEVSVDKVKKPVRDAFFDNPRRPVPNGRLAGNGHRWPPRFQQLFF